MKAAVVREHGGPDRLTFETSFPDPTPGEGDVIVAVERLSSRASAARNSASTACRWRPASSWPTRA